MVENVDPVFKPSVKNTTKFKKGTEQLTSVEDVNEKSLEPIAWVIIPNSVKKMEKKQTINVKVYPVAKENAASARNYFALVKSIQIMSVEPTNAPLVESTRIWTIISASFKIQPI